MTTARDDKTSRGEIVAWATAAKRQALAADLDQLPSDESLLRAAVAVMMLTRGPFPPMHITAGEGTTESFERSSAIVMIAISFDDDPPNTKGRAALFATRLNVEEVARG